MSSASTRGASIGKITCVSEPSSSITSTSTSIVGSAGIGERRVLERLRADPEDHLAVPRRRGRVSGSSIPANETRPSATTASTRFIAGEPMNAATKRLSGRV